MGAAAARKPRALRADDQGVWFGSGMSGLIGWSIAVQDVGDRVPHLGSAGASLKQQMKDRLIVHKHYIDAHGEDMPEIQNWMWNGAK